MSLLNLTCDIIRPTISQGAIGGTKYDWTTTTTVASGLVCAIQNASPTDIDLFSRRGATISTVVYYQDNTISPQIDDRVVDARYTPNKYYNIVAPQNDMGGTGEWFKLYCVEVVK
jgi:hypothetical protein